MIAYLKGHPIEVSLETLIIDVSGVGYELWCSQNSLKDFSFKEEVVARVFTHVREDALQLFGFSTDVEKNMFLSLVKVNGIGPKMALAVLSATQLDTLIEIIEQGDVKALSQLPKIGKKKAEQIVLTLKGQLKFAEERDSEFSARSDIKSALVNLGFKSNDVDSVVSDMDPKTDLQSGIRKGLSILGAQP